MQPTQTADASMEKTQRAVSAELPTILALVKAEEAEQAKYPPWLLEARRIRFRADVAQCRRDSLVICDKETAPK